MNKITLLLFCTFITICSVAQKHNVTSAAITFKQFKGDNTEKLKEAKNFIDQAYKTESTSNDPKMWNYRAPIYLEIAQKHSELDKDAVLKATEAYLKCLQADHKGRIIVRKWTPKEDVLSGLVKCGYTLFNKAVEEHNAGDYKRAITLYNAIFDVIPHDEEDQLKRGNITKETILYNSFFASNKMKDNQKSKDLLQKLININFNEPAIYIHMSNIYVAEDKTDKALEYLSLGREMFEEDQSLIDAEIRLYTKLGRTSELIEKLTLAIESDPENEIYYIIRGTCYQNLKLIDKAITDYILALEINPAESIALNNISASYLEKTEPLIKDLNNTDYNKKTKISKLEDEIERLYKKALPHLIKYTELEPTDMAALNTLATIYYKLGMEKESKETRNRLAEKLND